MADNIEPDKRYVPTEQSLDLAEEIAQTLGKPFDREGVRKLSTELYDRMFADLVRVLGLDIPKLNFLSGVRPTARAFSALTKTGEPAVYLDMVFDHWVISLSHLVGICTFTQPPADDQRRIAQDFIGLFELFSHSGAYEHSRERMAYYIRHPDYGGQVFEIMFLCARAMVVFVLCHELAHHTLGHFKRASRKEDELEADALAVQYFHRVVDAGKQQSKTYIHVDQKIECAPIILSMVFELYETWLVDREVSLESISEHPPAAQRTAQLQRLMKDRFNIEATQILDGAAHAISGLFSLLGLEQPKVSS